MNAALEFRDVDILFSREQGRKNARSIRDALARLDAGATREEISAACGVVVGVAGASLGIAPGEICVMMGLSGSGKSTLLRAANGLTAVTRGQVLIDDRQAPIDVAHCGMESLRRLRRERVAMVFQQFGLLPWRTVADNVGLGLELRGEPEAERRRIVAEQLDLVGLTPWADRDVGELSGGMQQRVGLARAFATKADILLMDEPFAALDEQTRLLLGDKVLQIQQQLKQTTLLITHNITEAVQMSDRILVMTYRPGKVKRIVDINLPRPRTSEIVGSEAFGRYVAQIWSDLREEASRGMQDEEKHALEHPGAAS